MRLSPGTLTLVGVCSAMLVFVPGRTHPDGRQDQTAGDHRITRGDETTLPSFIAEALESLRKARSSICSQIRAPPATGSLAQRWPLTKPFRKFEIDAAFVISRS
jgi:hypothetical protein